MKRKVIEEISIYSVNISEACSSQPNNDAGCRPFLKILGGFNSAFRRVQLGI